MVVGTGIRAGIHLTPQASEELVAADRVFYQCADPIAAAVIEGLNQNAVSLEILYAVSKPRAETYDEMAELILDSVREGHRVCAAFYGHPGVVVAPGHEAIRRARLEGYNAIMIPGVSAEDCLLADLGINPGDQGLQMYKANDFVLRPRQIDVTTPLILWQPIVVGEQAAPGEPNAGGIALLAEALTNLYGADHPVVLYEAAIYPVGGPTVMQIKIGELAQTDMPMRATLYVAPLGQPVVDEGMALRLGVKVASASSSAAS